MLCVGGDDRKGDGKIRLMMSLLCREPEGLPADREVRRCDLLT